MFYWMKKRDFEAYKSVQRALESLRTDVRVVHEGQRTLEKQFTEIDTEMSVLWDKVNHALARLGGRKSKKPEEPNGDKPPQSVDDLNLAIMRGEVTSWPS